MGRTSYVFMGTVSMLQKVHKKEYVTEAFSHRNAPESGRPYVDHMEATERHSWVNSCLTWAQWWGTWGSQQRNASMLLCKVPSALQRGMRQKMKIVGDGNCRNGYHKVKCQVPETEELHRWEKERRGEKNKSTRATERLPVATAHNIKMNVRKLSFSSWCLT